MIDSPCVNQCCLNQQDVCVGCFRHISEIVGWQDAPESRKAEIIRLCDLRRRRAREGVNSDPMRPESA